MASRLVAVCCRVLQCVAVCRRVLQCVAADLESENNGLFETTTDALSKGVE